MTTGKEFHIPEMKIWMGCFSHYRRLKNKYSVIMHWSDEENNLPNKICKSFLKNTGHSGIIYANEYS